MADYDGLNSLFGNLIDKVIFNKNYKPILDNLIQQINVQPDQSSLFTRTDQTFLWRLHVPSFVRQEWHIPRRFSQIAREKNYVDLLTPISHKYPKYDM